GVALTIAASLWRMRRRFGECGVALANAASLWRMRRRLGECGVALAIAARPWRLLQNHVCDQDGSRSDPADRNSGLNGGGISLVNGSDANIINNVIAQNTASNPGGGI
ncbi:MAG: hypothetical protein DMG13_00700, partial [Acidobacteria bacterium]